MREVEFVQIDVFSDRPFAGISWPSSLMVGA
jgi:hypothetical protein